MVARPIKPISPIGLLETLRHYRTDQAYIQAVPPSAVYSNKLLKGIVTARPSTLTSLLKLHGIGPTRCQKYGKDIVRMVNLDSKITRDKITPITPKITPVIPKINPPKITPPKIKIPQKTSKQITSRFFKKKTVKSVYVLELEDGRVYVGSSQDVPRRLSQHAAGSGAAYTRLYRPTGVQLPRLGNVQGDGDAAERDETLRYMMLRGIPYVRGWKFARVDMPPEEFDEAEANIREMFDLCRRCGYKGHFCTYCKATFDRLGRPVRR